ncbi:MAG: (deoxy)nucleoside triphosphate pyrophosphohydrolase [Prevotella sp.]|nr:(deoxy)nucleoside triphosphate pyrophosphohydrolase [Prevotella sp.]
MEKINVVAAVIVKDGQYLCVQRCRSHQSYNSERWEFPGGKVEKGESDYEALLREIKEEMDWDIYVGRRLGVITHDYPDFTINLKAYLCKPGDGDFTLLEHLDARWLPLDQLDTLNWAEADKKIVQIMHNS